MRVLVTNDDGIFSKGIGALVESLEDISEVYVIAPDRERSASSHSITFHKPLRVDIVSLPHAKKAWKVDGTPADCVKIALNSILDFKPDIVISGINRGPNLGCDVLYSGTVAAAIEGHINGTAGIAISHANFNEDCFKTSANISKLLIELLFKQRLIEKSTLININFPNNSKIMLDDCVVTSLGERKYENIYDLRVDPRGREYYWLAGDIINCGSNIGEGLITDIEAVSRNKVSITPLQVDLTDYGLLEQMQSFLTTHVFSE